MANATCAVRIEIKNLLYLTDFSEPSEAALPFATAIARKYSAKIHALHVVVPVPFLFTAPETIADSIAAEEEIAEADMQRLDSHLNGVPHETTIQRGPGLWCIIENAIKASSAEIIVLGTHGRTGAQKFLLGSVAEEVFRRSPIPVLTIGPRVRRGVHNGGRFRRILFATDFSAESAAAAPYAISLAQENQARLLLVHVVRQRDHDRDDRVYELSVAEAIHRLYETVPEDVQLSCPPEVSVEHGKPGKRIVEAAEERSADLIVLGVRDAAGHLSAATHFERNTAHHVVAHAACPVLTVRSSFVQSAGGLQELRGG
jgi:nucleotide-binding universal stress UspA family protein